MLSNALQKPDAMGQTSELKSHLKLRNRGRMEPTYLTSLHPALEVNPGAGAMAEHISLSAIVWRCVNKVSLLQGKRLDSIRRPPRGLRRQVAHAVPHSVAANNVKC